MPDIIIIRNTYQCYRDMEAVIQYVSRSDLFGGYGIDPYHAFQQFVMVKRYHHNEGGVQIHHFVLSFSTQDLYRLTIDEMMEFGTIIGEFFKNYQMLFSLHTDTDHFHLHVVMNSVSFSDGHKYADGLYGFVRLRDALNDYFPYSRIRIFESFPNSEINRYSYSNDDELLRLY